MIKDYKITEMLFEKCVGVIVKNDSWLCRCPLCGDSVTKKHAKRFHIDYYPQYNTYMYKCFRCNESNNVYILHSLLYGVSYIESKKWLNDTIFDSNSIKKQITKDFDNLPDKIHSELDIDIEQHCYRSTDTPSSIVGKKLIKKLNFFIDTRKIVDDCFIAHSGRYKSRIILPIINGNKLEYFQGRSLYNDIEPKYLNPYVEKENIIYHQGCFDNNKPIIITEGLIDAMSIGNQGTCCLGSNISDSFLDIIYNHTKKDVIIALDNIFIDAAAKAQLLKILVSSKYAKKLKYFFIPEKFHNIKDINELVTKYDVGNVENFIRKNSFSFLKAKIRLLS